MAVEGWRREGQDEVCLVVLSHNWKANAVAQSISSVGSLSMCFYATRNAKVHARLLASYLGISLLI